MGGVREVCGIIICASWRMCISFHSDSLPLSFSCFLSTLILPHPRHYTCVHLLGTFTREANVYSLHT